MKIDRKVGTVRGLLVMVAAIIAGVILFTTIDVQVSLSQIDATDSTTWPHMAPQIRYFFIPFFSAAVALCALAIVLFMYSFNRRRFAQQLHWALVGLAFSLASLVLPLVRVGVEFSTALFISFAASLSVSLWVWLRFSVSYVPRAA